MQDPQIGRISNFIWSVADDALRDIYVRGKYRDVILPMTVLRRLDAVLEETKEAVIRQKETPGRRRNSRAGRPAQTGRQAGLLQRLALHAQEPAHEQPAAVGLQLRGVSRRLFLQRPGHTGQLRVPQPDTPSEQVGRAWNNHRKVHLAGHQPVP